MNGSKNYLDTLHSKIISVSQRIFLDRVLALDICSSIRPKIDKVFIDPDLDNLKSQYLKEYRLKIARINLQEADNDIIHLKQQFNDFF